MHDSWGMLRGRGWWWEPRLSYLPSPLMIPLHFFELQDPTLPTFQNAHPLIQMVSPYLLYTYPDKVPKLFFFSLTYSSSELVVSSLGNIGMIPEGQVKVNMGSCEQRGKKQKDRKGLATSLPLCQCLLEQEHYPHRAEGTCHQGQPTCGLVLALGVKRRNFNSSEGM